VAVTFRNLAISFIQAVFIKTKPFAPVLIRAVILTLYPFQDTVHGTIKYFPPIN
jgi:hypothetical protein